MKKYVFIGFNGLFGDYADIVHANGGVLAKVVINLPRDTNTGRGTFAEQLARYHIWQNRAGHSRAVLEELREFRPQTGEQYVLACRGVTTIRLADYLVNNLGIALEPLVHPSAIISPTVLLPAGIIIHSQVHIGADVTLGAYAAIKTGCYIGHDSKIGDFADLSPSVSLASGTIVERGAQLGINCTIINGVRIGAGAVVAAGAVVTRNVTPHTLVAGVPAVEKKTIPERTIPETVAGL